MMHYPKTIQEIDEQRIGDELFIYGSNGEKLTVLNSTAMLIWSLCDGTHTVDDMVTVIHDIIPETDEIGLKEDIIQTVSGLSQKHLITDHPQPTS